MNKLPIYAVIVAALSACAPGIPDSAAGVGFDDYGTYQKRQAAAQAQARTANALPAPATVASANLDKPTAGPEDAAAIAAQTRAALGTAPATNATVPVPAVERSVANNTAISNENSFEAVSTSRTIESDAERLARIRSEYQVVQPKALPSRDGASGPNLAEYALQTTNAPGQSVYKRSAFSTAAKAQRNCAAYPSPDLAQTEFLAKGGPKQDRKGLDPDGDGFACSWSPLPFRKSVNG